MSADFEFEDTGGRGGIGCLDIIALIVCICVSVALSIGALT